MCWRCGTIRSRRPKRWISRPVPCDPAHDSALLDVSGLHVEFRTRRRVTHAVRGLSFTVGQNETVAIVGESGSGKSVTALSVMRLIAQEGGTITAGRIGFTRRDGKATDLAACPEPEMRRIRGGEIAMIFQEPMTSLNPIRTIGAQLAEVLTLHEGLGQAQAMVASRRMLDRVRIPEAPAACASIRTSCPAACAARHDRHGAAMPPAAAAGGRADHGAGRDHPGADPGPDRGAEGGYRHGRAVHHPRPGHRGRDGRPRRGDARWRGGGAGRDRTRVRHATPRLHPRPGGRGPQAGQRRRANRPAPGPSRAAGGRAGETLPDPPRPLAPGLRHRPRRGRRQLRPGRGGDAGAGGRVRLRQEHGGPRGPEASGTQRGPHQHRRAGCDGPVATRDAPGPARHPDGVPGPLRLAQSKAVGAGAGDGAAGDSSAGHAGVGTLGPGGGVAAPRGPAGGTPGAIPAPVLGAVSGSACASPAPCAWRPR